jgi:hypothetical protein
VERPWDRRASLALILLALGCLASLPWLVHPWFDADDQTNDAAIYVACARSLLAGEGTSYLGEPFTVRPPGLSWMIAPLLAWWNGDFHALNLQIALFGVACTVLLFVHARARLGTSLALLVAAALWLSNPFQRLCNQTLSDVPGAALLLACLLVERWAARRPSLCRDLLLGASIGASTYVRSVTLLLLPAIAVARITARWCERGRPAARSWRTVLLAGLLPLVATALLVKMPWDLYCARHPPVPPVDQNFLHSYATAMWRVDAGDPASPRRELSEIAGRAPERFPQVLALLGSRMRTSASGAAALAGALLLGLGLIVVWQRRASAELFALFLLGVLLVYFAFRDRLVLPLWILLLPAAVEGLLIVLRRACSPRRAAASAGVLLLCLPALDFRPREGWEEIAATHDAFTRFASDVQAAVPSDARLASQIGWHYSVFLERPVWSLFFAARRAGGMQGAQAVLDRYAIDAVVLAPRNRGDASLVPWFQEHYGPPRVAGSALVFTISR